MEESPVVVAEPPIAAKRPRRPAADPVPPPPAPGVVPIRFGFAVKVMGQKGLKSNDTRRWQKDPHLRVSLEYIRAIFGYLKKKGITMYRISSDIAPYLTHPQYTQFRNQIEEAGDDLALTGQLAAEQGLRLSFHPSQYIILNSPDERLVAQSIHDVNSQAEMLDRMGQSEEGVVVIHVGGVYGDRVSARDRWCKTYERLSPSAQRRLALENDDISFSAADVLHIHERTGVKLIFDHQHYWCLNPERLELRPTVERFVKAWPAGVRPKMHYSSPRTELREFKRKNKKTKKNETVLQPPLLTGHADYNNPIEFIQFMRQMEGLEFDIMLEAKAKDLALLRLRRDLVRCAPELAQRLGILASSVEEEPAEIIVEEGEQLEA